MELFDGYCGIGIDPGLWGSLKRNPWIGAFKVLRSVKLNKYEKKVVCMSMNEASVMAMDG
jgi:hypothetical protein